jgi:hypothetical protein
MTIQDLITRSIVDPNVDVSGRRQTFWHGPNSTDVSQWIRQLYPVGQQQAHTVQDVDWLIRNYKTRRMLIIETKCNMGSLTGGQWDTYKTLDQALRHGLPAIGWQWLGCWVLTYEGATFPTDTVYFAPYQHCTKLTVRDHPERRDRYKMPFADFESIMLSV